MHTTILAIPLAASLLFSACGINPIAGASLKMVEFAENAINTAAKNDAIAIKNETITTNGRSTGLKEEAEKKARSFGFSVDEAYLATRDDYIYNTPDGIKMAYLPQNSIVRVLDLSEWSLVRSGGIEGYVKTTSLTHSFEDFINSDRLIETINVWDFAYSTADGNEKISLVLPGDYEVVEEGARDLIRLHDGKTGYVNRQTVYQGNVKATLYNEDDMLRLSFISYALPLEGKVPYVWGGKPYIKDGEITIGSGLDCSGLIEYCAMCLKRDYGIELNCNDYLSTESISRTLDNTFAPKFGDLGLKEGTGTYYTDSVGRRYPTPDLAEQGSEELGTFGIEPVVTRFTDHVGVYLGTKGGKTWFIHENGTDDNVAIDNGDCFKVGKRLLPLE